MKIMEQFSLKGKTALITGAAHGIGKACALALAQAGANTVVTDINLRSDVKQVEEEIKALNAESISFKADVTHEKEMESVVQAAVEKFGALDIAFCNAGTFQNIPAEEMTLEEFQRVINVNLTGAFITARAAGKSMIEKKNGGSIIMTASMSGHIANIPQCQVAYNASKAGVIQLGRSLAIEWAKHNIRVNTISPGYIYTYSDEPIPPEKVGTSLFEQWTPMKRFGKAEEIGGLVVYLASDASSFVTGTDILVDGGYTSF